MFFCSDIITSGVGSNYWLSQEYSGNNARIFNGNNGTLNNNNKMNGNGVRGCLAFGREKVSSDSFVRMYANYLECYKVTRRTKRNKNSQLQFEYNLQHELVDLCTEINNGEYEPRPSTRFYVTKPTMREILAADFRDRIPQTRVVLAMQPLLEKYVLDDDSYSCRKGKGALRAVRRLLEHIRRVTADGTTAYVYKFDLKSFFMSIDVNLMLPRLLDTFNGLYSGNDKDEIMYLARVIFQSLPQCHCHLHGQPDLQFALPKDKSLIGKTDGVGIPLGDRTSQMMSLFATTLLLGELRKFSVKFAHYTDDNGGVITDKRNFMKIYRYLKVFLKERLHLTMHPCKFYLQDSRKTFAFLGYKVKYGCLLLPGDRVVHNFKRTVTLALRDAEADPVCVYRRKDRLVGRINSYLGTIRHTASYNIRKSQIGRLMQSPWAYVLDFDTENYHKINAKRKYSLAECYILLNKQRKKNLKHDSN